MTLRDQIVQEALTWEGTPFHRGARVRGVGGDCYAILWTIYVRHLGVEPWCPYGSPPEPYTRLFNGQWEWHTKDELFLEAMRLYMPALQELPWRDAQPGDVFVTGRAGQPANHVAYLLPGDCILHARGDPRCSTYRGTLMRERRHPAFDKTIRMAFLLTRPDEVPYAGDC